MTCVASPLTANNFSPCKQNNRTALPILRATVRLKASSTNETLSSLKIKVNFSNILSFLTKKKNLHFTHEIILHFLIIFFSKIQVLPLLKPIKDVFELESRMCIVLVEWKWNHNHLPLINNGQK